MMPYLCQPSILVYVTLFGNNKFLFIQFCSNPAKIAKRAEGTDTSTATEAPSFDPNESAVDKLSRLKQGQQMVERVAPNMVRIFEKLFLPQKQYPTIKYPGRIIGPGGSTVKEVNNLTGCKLLVRGKGSFKVPHQVCIALHCLCSIIISFVAQFCGTRPVTRCLYHSDTDVFGYNYFQGVQNYFSNQFFSRLQCSILLVFLAN